MKVTVVPAQITTVEDRVMGSLSFSQMLLVIAPIFLSAALFGLLPPVMSGSIYKYVIMGIIVLLSCVLAIRIKGKILASWLTTILRYNLRPKYYVFNKNVTTLRENYPEVQAKQESKVATTTQQKSPNKPKLNLPEAAKVLATIENPSAKLRFETTKRGGLYVRFTEIEE